MLFMSTNSPGDLNAEFQQILAHYHQSEQARLEMGLWAALNDGHTFAHAYETVAGYGTLPLGEAVAIGMAKAARLAARIGRVSGEIVAR
jgi:3-dehydroquinate synthetase